MFESYCWVESRSVGVWVTVENVVNHATNARCVGVAVQVSIEMKL